MNPKKTIAFIILAAAFGLFWHYYEVKGGAEREKSAEEAKLIFSGLAEDPVTVFSIHRKDEQTLTLRKEGRDWFLVEPLRARADLAQVNTLLGKLADLKNEETLIEAGADLAQFSLKTPLTQFRFKQLSSSAKAILFGAQNPMGTHYYSVAEGLPALMMVASTGHDALVKEIKDLRDRAVWRFDSSTVTRVVSKIKDAKYEVKKDEKGAWQMLSPKKIKANQQKISELANKCLGMKIKDFINEDGSGLEGYGLKTAGETLRLGFGAADGDRVLVKGGKTADDNAFFCRVTGRPGVFTVEKSVIESLVGDVETLEDRDAFSLESWKIEKAIVTRGGESLTASKTDGQWAWAGGNTLNIKADFDFYGFFNEVAQTRILKHTAEGSKTGAAIVTLAFFDTEGQPIENIELGGRGKSPNSILASSSARAHVVEISDEFLQKLP